MTESVLLRGRRAEASAVSEAVAELGASEAGRRQLAAEFESLVSYCAEGSLDVRLRWVAYESGWPSGQPEALQGAFEHFLARLDSLLRIADGLLAIVHDFGPAEVSTSGQIALLRQTASDLRGFHQHLTGLWEWLKAPAPPPGEDVQRMTEVSRQQQVRGEGEDIEAVLRRVKAGGALTRE